MLERDTATTGLDDTTAPAAVTLELAGTPGPLPPSFFSKRPAIQSLTAPGPAALLSIGDFRCMAGRRLDQATAAFEAMTLAASLG